MSNNDRSESNMELVEDVNRCYMSYMRSLKKVLDRGGLIVEDLTNSLSKFSNASVIALGYLMHTHEAKQAIPVLLDWILLESPIYSNVIASLLLAGAEVVHPLIAKIRALTESDDVCGLRNLFDLGLRLPRPHLDRIMAEAALLLDHPLPDFREIGADAFYSIGHTCGVLARERLALLAANDSNVDVRASAAKAIEEFKFARRQSDVR